MRILCDYLTIAGHLTKQNGRYGLTANSQALLSKRSHAYMGSMGDFLASDGQQPVFTKNIISDSGSAIIQLNRTPGTPGVNGGGVLITLNFQAIARGMTVVNIPGLMVRNSQGQPVATGNPQVSIRVQ